MDINFVCVLNDGDTWTTLNGCEVVALDRETFEQVSDGASVAFAQAVRAFNLTSPTSLRALADMLESQGAK